MFHQHIIRKKGRFKKRGHQALDFADVLLKLDLPKLQLPSTTGAVRCGPAQLVDSTFDNLHILSIGSSSESYNIFLEHLYVLYQLI